MRLLTKPVYLATGSTQLNFGDLHGVSQPTVSRVVSLVINALTAPNIINQYIHMPTSANEVQQLADDFFGIAAFPNVIGVIDGTQIQIQAPIVDEPDFINRLGYHSINTQIVFGGNYIIRDIVARWPGATHDSRILKNSGVYTMLDGGHIPVNNKYLLGDSGYPCKRCLLTPYMNPQQGSQTAYNRAHKKTRSLVERGIGTSKRRWGILHGEIRAQPEKATKVVMSLAILHNICRSRNIQMPDEPEIQYNNNQNNISNYDVIT